VTGCADGGQGSSLREGNGRNSLERVGTHLLLWMCWRADILDTGSPVVFGEDFLSMFKG
jgi:hypothetical protein